MINARFIEKYGENFGITMPDEHHLRSVKFDGKFSSELALDKGIFLFNYLLFLFVLAAFRYRTRIDNGEIEEEEDEDEEPSGSGSPKRAISKKCDVFSNSRMSFGNCFH